MKSYLPIGSIVLIKNIDKKMMITGFSQIRDLEVKERWDYVAVIYPMGIFSDRSFYFFNEDSITDVIFKGYENPEHEEFLKLIEEAEELMSNIEEEKTSQEQHKNEVIENTSAFD